MILMNDLKTTTKLVKAILEQDEKARNSDSYLYHKVLESVALEKGIDTKQINMHDFWVEWYWLFPNTETVRRTRQKIQATHPHLAACGRVGAMREVNEQEFRSYAKGDLT